MTLIDLRSLYVDADILENEIGLVQSGSNAKVSFTAFPGESFAGSIVSINPLIDIEKKTRRVTVLIDNPANRLIAGMFATVVLDAEILEDRLLVPKEAIVLRDDRPVVFIARENENGELRAVWSYVETGKQNEEFVEIISSKFDLKPGESVVIDNHYTMIHDAKIRKVKRSNG